MSENQKALDEIMVRLDSSRREQVLAYALEYARRILAEQDRDAEFTKAVKGFRVLDSSGLRAASGNFRAIFTDESRGQHFQVGEDVPSIQEALKLLRIDEMHPSLEKRIYDEQGNSILLQIKQLRQGDKFRRINTPPDNPVQFDDLLELTWISFLEGLAGFKCLKDETEWQTGWNVDVVKVLGV